MWLYVNLGCIIACHFLDNCFKYCNLQCTVAFAWCYWEKIKKFNIFRCLPVSAVSVSDNFSSPHGDSRWGRGKWLEATVDKTLSMYRGQHHMHHENDDSTSPVRDSCSRIIIYTKMYSMIDSMSSFKYQIPTLYWLKSGKTFRIIYLRCYCYKLTRHFKCILKPK